MLTLDTSSIKNAACDPETCGPETTQESEHHDSNLLEKTWNLKEKKEETKFQIQARVRVSGLQLSHLTGNKNKSPICVMRLCLFASMGARMLDTTYQA